MAYTNTRAKQSQAGQLGFLADEEMGRLKVVGPGTDDDHVELIDAVTDQPLGMTVDGCEAAEDAVAVDMFGKGETKVGKMSGTVSKDEPLCPAVDGTGDIRKVPTDAGAYWLIGWALEDGADDQEIGFDDVKPRLVGAYDSDSGQFSLPAFAGDPTTPLESGLWYDLTNDRYRIRNGTALGTVQVVED